MTCPLYIVMVGIWHVPHMEQTTAHDIVVLIIEDFVREEHVDWSTRVLCNQNQPNSNL